MTCPGMNTMVVKNRNQTSVQTKPLTIHIFKRSGTCLSALDILTVARKSGLLTFVNMAEETGLDKILHKKGPHTIFVPTDEAFAGELRNYYCYSYEFSRNRPTLSFSILTEIRFKNDFISTIPEPSCLFPLLSHNFTVQATVN